MLRFFAVSPASIRSSLSDQILRLDQRLPKNPPTATLSLSEKNMDNNNYQRVMRAVGEATSFSCLNLSLTALDKERVKFLTDALIANPAITALTINCRMCDEVFSLFMKELQKRTENISLDFQFNPDGPQCGGLLLYNSGSVFAATISKLTKLSFSNCYLNNSDVKALGAALLHNTSLESLDMSDNTRASASFRPLAAAIAVNDTLKSLKLNWAIVEMDESSLVLRMLGINTSLIRLELIGNNYVFENYLVLLEVLKEHPTLEMLHVEADPFMDCLETATFTDVFGVDSKLRTLVFSGINISNLNSARFTLLIEKLMENKSLQKLSLTSLEIYDDSASDALAKVIETATIISEISIRKIHCSLEGFKTLSNAFVQNESIKSFGMVYSPEQEAFATAFFKAIERNEKMLLRRAMTLQSFCIQLIRQTLLKDLILPADSRNIDFQMRTGCLMLPIPVQTKILELTHLRIGLDLDESGEKTFEVDIQ